MTFKTAVRFLRSLLRPLRRFVRQSMKHLVYFVRRHFGHLRVTKPVTRILGVQYRRSLRKIEIDITYACNLSCPNCNRSCTQAPTGERMTVEQIDFFLKESIASGIKWDRIRLLGGEPTLHPHFHRIIQLLLEYRERFSKDTCIEVSTHGYGTKVEQALSQISHPAIRICNSRKRADTPPLFEPFNVAPRDLKRYVNADFRNGCWVIDSCGTGLSGSGFYPCAVAAGIDRIMGWDIGRKSLPADDDSMQDLLSRFCSHCGHFDRNLVEPLETESVMSSTWVEAYAGYHKVKRITRYGAQTSLRNGSDERTTNKKLA